MKVHKYVLLAGILAICPALRAHGVQFPFDAVVGGRDASGYLLYVCAGTVQASGGPAGVYPGWWSSDGCHIGSFQLGREVVSDHGSERFLTPTWVTNLSGTIPANAVQGGYEPAPKVGLPATAIYICRGKLGGALIVGEIRKGTSTCLVTTSANTVVSLGVYDVLVTGLPLTRVANSAVGHQPPLDGIKGGYDVSTVDPLYICTASHNGSVRPGALRKGYGCYIAHQGSAVWKTTYNVVAAAWEPSSRFPSQPPKFDFAFGMDAQGQPLYICRAQVGPQGAGGLRSGLIGKYLAPCQVGYGGATYYPGTLDLLTSYPGMLPPAPPPSSGL